LSADVLFARTQKQQKAPKPKKVKVMKHQPVGAPASLGKQGFLQVMGITTQDFENATFPPTSWRVGNPNAGTTTWTRSTEGSGFGIGTASAFIDFYNYATAGQRDSLKTPVLTGLVNGDLLRFDVAYPYNSYGNDSLIVRISTNGGTTFSGTHLYKKGGLSLATVGSVGNEFDNEFLQPDGPLAEYIP
jgi:hypothetical protein